MQKIKQLTKSSISKSEFELLSSMDKANLQVFGPTEVQRLLGCGENSAYNLLHNLESKGVITRIRRGAYAISVFSMAPGSLSVATRIVWPSYVSFWTALNYHGFTEQLPSTIFVATTKSGRPLTFGGSRISFVRLDPYRFFGYQDIKGIVMASREKAIVDSLLLPRYAGGIEEVSKCLVNAWDQLDKRTLVEYSVRMRNISLLKRLGYLAESAGLRNREVMGLRKRIGRGYSKLDPQLPKSSRYDREWGLIINTK
jgi:predicted transcriptional regulator of viral defense system